MKTFYAFALFVLFAVGVQAAPVTLNGHTYNASDFAGYGYTKIFPTPILPDMLSEIAAQTAGKQPVLSNYSCAGGKYLKKFIAPNSWYCSTPAGSGGVTDYNALTNRPTISTVGTTGAYGDLTGKPTLAQTKDCSILGAGYHLVKYDASTGLSTCTADATTGGATDTNALHAANNLSEITNLATARANLGIVVEYATNSAFPSTGAVAVIYSAKDTNKIYRWDSSAESYALLAGSGTTDYTALTNKPTLGTAAAQPATAFDAAGAAAAITTITGNAGTATKLATPRAINGTNFDGSAAITITAAPTAHNQAWSTITATPTTVAGYGITDAVPTTRTINGQPLTGNITIATGGLPVDSPTFTTGITGPVFTSNATDGNHYVGCSNSGPMTTTGWTSADAGKFCWDATLGKFRYWTGSALSDWSGSGAVSSVNSQTGAVTIVLPQTAGCSAGSHLNTYTPSTGAFTCAADVGTGGGISGTTGTIPNQIITATATDGAIQSSPVQVSATGTISLPSKANGAVESFMLWDDYGTETYGFGWLGPHATSTMSHSIYLQPSSTPPSAGQIMIAGTPTSAAVNGEVGAIVIPMTWGANGTSISLTDSVTSTSTTTAATPNSVKQAYDLAATKDPLDAMPTVITGTSLTVTKQNTYAICTGSCTVTPIAPITGAQLCIRNSPGGSYTISLAALGSGKYYEKPDHSGYGTATTGTLTATASASNQICLTALDSTHYIILGSTGTWTAN